MPGHEWERWPRPGPASDARPAASSVSYCTGCGRSATAGDRFCGGCGTALRVPDASASTEAAAGQDELLRHAHHLLVTGHVREAIPLLERLHDERPDQPVLLAYLGVAYLRVARVAEAQLSIEQATALAPEDFTCRMAYGEYFARLGFYDRAVDQLDRTLGLAAPSDEAYRAAFELRRFCHEKTKGLVYRRTALPPLPRLFRGRARRAGAASAHAETRRTP